MTTNYNQLTKEKQNIKVHGFIDGGCYHDIDWNDHPDNYTAQFCCKHCGKLGDTITNPDYLNEDGMISIEEWLVEQGTLQCFRNWTKLSTKSYLTITSEKFIPKFLEYMEKE